MTQRTQPADQVKGLLQGGMQGQRSKVLPCCAVHLMYLSHVICRPFYVKPAQAGTGKSQAQFTCILCPGILAALHLMPRHTCCFASHAPAYLLLCIQEQRQQSMAGYAAELQAQIAEKESRKRMERQESLRQSQDLLAQRMARPSGLVCYNPRASASGIDAPSHRSCYSFKTA